MHPYELSNLKPREVAIIGVFNVHSVVQKLRACKIIGSIGVTVTDARWYFLIVKLMLIIGDLIKIDDRLIAVVNKWRK